MPPLPALAAGISAVTGIGSGLIDAAYAKRNTDLQNKANIKLAEYQYSKDLEMWNKGNAYNAPIEQMKRLKEAGLNPNLVYGNGAGQSQAAALPKYQAPTQSYNYKPPVDPLAMLGAFQDFQLRNAQIRTQNAEAEKGETENLYLKSFLIGRNSRQKQDIDKNVFNFDTANEKLAQLQELGTFNRQIRERNLKQADATIESTQAGTRLRNLNANMFDWTAWTRILSSFGVRLPSFRK
ncbi:MAG: DNA pilot protein [Microviridae sp.]|nr:MAG: DNA pilot protein [Microviridae sp.]